MQTAQVEHMMAPPFLDPSHSHHTLHNEKTAAQISLQSELCRIKIDHYVKTGVNN